MNYVKSKDTKVYALGTFDGIHRGHQRVIRKLLKKLHQLMVLALSLPLNIIR